MIALPGALHASKLSRAWKAFTEGDYTGCRELCDKVLEKDSLNPFANYLVGLTIDQIGKTTADFYLGLDMTDRATRGAVYTRQSDLDELSEEFGFSVESIGNLKEKLGTRLLDLIGQSPDIQAYNTFIRRIGIVSLKEDAVVERNHFAFLLADAKGTVDAYKQFMDDYPTAKDHGLAQRRIHHLFYVAAKSDMDSLIVFIRQYPGAEDVVQAERDLVNMAVELALKNNSITHLESFKRKVPELSGLQDVQRRFYQTHFKIISPSDKIEDWISFTDTYEKALKDESVMSRMETIIISDSLSASALDGLSAWFKRHPYVTASLLEKFHQRNMQNKVLIPFVETTTFKWGFCDQSGQMMCEPVLSLAYPFVKGVALIQTEDGAYRYIKTDFSTVGGAYRHALPFSNGMALALGRKNEYGSFDDNLVILSTDGKETILGVVDEEDCYKGRMIQPLHLDSVGRSESGKTVFLASAGNKTWMVQGDVSFQSFNVPLPAGFQGEVLAYSSGGVFPFRTGANKFGLIDYRGRIQCPAIYDFIAPSGIPMAFVANVGGYGYRCNVEGGNWGVIRNNGVEVIKLQYTNIGYFDDGPAPFLKEDKWGFVSESGKVLTPPIYDRATVFKNHVAQAGVDGRTFLVNGSGIEIRGAYHVPQMGLSLKSDEKGLCAYITTKLQRVLSNDIGESEVVDEELPPQDAEQDPDEGKIYTYVEEQPVFPGGEAEMYEYMQKHMRYPPLARENGITGRVFLTFVVHKDGSVGDVRVLRGVGAGCDEEAVRIIKSMPRWKPGMHNGRPVDVQFNIPLNFHLR